MSDLETARATFAAARLPIPPVPAELEAAFRVRDKWVYGSGPGFISPYNLSGCVEAACAPGQATSLTLAHAGHGTNSYTMHYYLVRGALRLFFQNGWGGAYMDHDERAAVMLECYGPAQFLIDAVVRAEAAGQLGGERYLTVVGSAFYGSWWRTPGTEQSRARGPADAIRAALAWPE